jgi:hypothetical protein
MQQSIYDPGFVAYGGGATQTVVHPVVVIGLLLSMFCMLFLPRKYAVVAFLFLVLLPPDGQQFYVAGVHLFVHRILILTGWGRIAWSKLSSKGEICAGGITAIDKVFFFWAIFRAMAGIFLNGDAGAVIYQFGFLWDALGGYFLLRFLIQDEETILAVAKAFVVFVAIVGATMVYEKFHDLNLFGYLGTGSLKPDVREGAIRARGPFEHEILAGVVGATLLPLFFWLWHSGKSRLGAFVGVAGSTAMVLTSASSTPILTYAAVIFGCCFWVFRKQTRIFRWSIVIILVVLQVVMKAPVWFLINHIDIVAGNSGYHRAMLIDMFVRHFGDWWLVGTNDAKNWGYDMWDTSNQFVAEGEGGGVATFLCFVLLVSFCFAWIGRARKLVEGDRKKEWFFWFLGVAMLAHLVAYFGISYFDQTKFVWYTLLVVISYSTATVLKAKAPAEEPSEENLLGPQLSPAFPSPAQQPSGSFSYTRNAPPARPRSSYTGKLDKA